MPRMADCGDGDDGRAELLAEDAGVGEGEGAAGDFVGSELLVAGAVGEVDDGAGDAEEVLLFGLLDDGDDEAPLERDGDADVDVLVVEDGVALRGGVDDGVLPERLDGGARDEGHVGELDAVALLVLVLFFFAQLDDARHVHLEDGVDVGVGVLGLDHALGDDAAHLGHGDELAGLRLRAQPWRGCGGRCGRDLLRRVLLAAGLLRRAPPSMWPRMSCLVMRPEAPVPATAARSTLFSEAILRTSGEERRPSPADAGAAARLVRACRGRWAGCR